MATHPHALYQLHLLLRDHKVRRLLPAPISMSDVLKSRSHPREEEEDNNETLEEISLGHGLLQTQNRNLFFGLLSRSRQARRRPRNVRGLSLLVRYDQ